MAISIIRDDPTALAYAGHSVAYIDRMHDQGLHALDRSPGLEPELCPGAVFLGLGPHLCR